MFRTLALRQSKNGNEGVDDSATHVGVTVPVGRDRKIRTAPRTHQIAGFVPVPSEKINTPYSKCEIIFPSPE